MSRKAVKKRRGEQRLTIGNITVQMLSCNGELMIKYVTDEEAKSDVLPVIARSIFDGIPETPQLSLV